MPRQLYSEVQKLQKAWLFILALDFIICGVILFVATKNSTSIVELLIPIGIILLASAFVIWVFLSSKLEIIIDTHGLHYRYPIFYPKWKTIIKEDIKGYAIRNYDAIFEFGGWGIKNSKKKGRSVTIQGDIALELELTNGERILIGTQNKEAIDRAMKRIINGIIE